MQPATHNTVQSAATVAHTARHESGQPSRDELLLLATNRFCFGDTPDRLSVDQYKEAFYLLVEDVIFPTKQVIARSLAHSPFAPRQIVIYCALEHIDIAAPVLQHSKVLGNLDLLRILELKGAEHAQSIAKRTDLSASVMSRLQRFDDIAINELLSQNAASLTAESERSSDALFSRALSKDVAPAVAMETESLAEPESIEEIMPAMTADAARGAIPIAAEADEAVEIEARSSHAARQALLSAASRGARLDESVEVVETTDNSRRFQAHEFGDILERAAAKGSRQGVGILLAQQLTLELETAYQVLEDGSGDTLAVALKSCDIASAQANRIMMLTFPELGLSVHNALRGVRLYDRLTVESCQKAVESWPKAELASRPAHAPVSEAAPRRVEPGVHSTEGGQTQEERIAALG